MPALTPVMTPVEDPAVATVVVPLVQAPPVGVEVSVAVATPQRFNVPVGVVGVAFTVIGL